ncbi:hypothetical protein SAMN03159423_5573 [Bradyrhizobium sp. NFR13]|uniref:hypothetical protein n=1 Tax=Bradyrhizobium sp. NFR13 TaxID=1566285 RepID=UPI0008EDA190|nr:hypothetical protein [Bradyrhizobium sp. NFR13]SFM13640.1 hypothetical protein SAMN03159423_5573 [Bradyrhizobium sp. NFR13]
MDQFDHSTHPRSRDTGDPQRADSQAMSTRQSSQSCTAPREVSFFVRKISETTPADLGLSAGSGPVREVQRRNYYRAVDGDGSDHKAVGLSPFRSLLERDLRTLLSANPAIQCYAIEPHRLEYFIPTESGHARHTYVPDIVLRYRDGRVAVLDAKALFFTAAKAWQKCEPHITAAYHIDHNVPFVVLSEGVIRLQPRLSNCEIMKRHRYIVEDVAALMRTRDVIAHVRLPTTIAKVTEAARMNSPEGCNRIYTAVMNLALSGEIDLDLSKSFSLATEIRDRGQ